MAESEPLYYYFIRTLYTAALLLCRTAQGKFNYWHVECIWFHFYKFTIQLSYTHAHTHTAQLEGMRNSCN